MLPLLKAGGFALLFCLNLDCPDLTSMRMLVEAELESTPRKEEMMKIIECESGFDPLIQSRHKDPSGPNGREDSWGLGQINLKWNPHVTREQAQNWRFSLNFIKRNFEAGNESWMWKECWNKINQISHE